MKSTIQTLLVFAAILAMAATPLILWVAKSYFEAAAYNRVTGARVSTWDAMWVELRVTP